MDLLAWIRTSSRRRRRGFDEKEKVEVDGPSMMGMSMMVIGQIGQINFKWQAVQFIYWR